MYPDNEYDNRYENIENERKNYEKNLAEELSDDINYKQFYINAMGSLYELGKRADRARREYDRKVKLSRGVKLAYYAVLNAIEKEIESLTIY